MAPDGVVLQKVVASLKNVGEFDVSTISVNPASAVYKAVERKLRRALVIKIMPVANWSANHAQVLAMAAAERRVVKSFDFPNVPRLLSSGDIDDHFFWITEFVDGTPLDKTLQTGETMAALDLVDMARQLCASLESTSRSGIVHHRFHPGNLIVEWDGCAKILDWGVPPYCDLDANASTKTLNAAHYLAPEQLAGQVGDLRSNLFSVGAILYQLATAKLPFANGSIAALQASMEGDSPTSPSEWNGKIPVGISVPILKALSRNPEKRYQSASELIKDLENFRKFGVKNELPENFYTPKASPVSPASPAASSRPSFDSGLEFDNAWTPAMTAPRQTDVAVMSLQDSTVAVAEKPPEPTPAPIELPAPVKETVYQEPEPKPAAPAKPKVNLPKFKPPKVTMKDVNKVARKIPPLTAALVVAGLVAVFLIWKIVVPYTIIPKESSTAAAPAVATAAEQPPPQTAQPVTQPVEQQPEPVVEQAQTPAEPEVVVRNLGKSGRKSRTKTVPVAAPSVPVFGELSVNSDPAGASFQLDGRTDASWVTPFTVGQLSPGHHVVTFNKAGYQPQSLSAEVVAGSRATMMTRLSAQGGTLAVGSNPVGANIAIDGRDTGKKTPSQFILSRGQHAVTLKQMGYLEANVTVNIADGQNHSITPELIAMGRTTDIKVAKKGIFGFGRKGDKDMGQVSIRTNPNGAAVLVNGQLAPKATPLEFSLNPGGYELTFELHGYKTQKKTIVVEAGSKLTVDQNLESQ